MVKRLWNFRVSHGQSPILLVYIKSNLTEQNAKRSCVFTRWQHHPQQIPCLPVYNLTLILPQTSCRCTEAPKYPVLRLPWLGHVLESAALQRTVPICLHHRAMLLYNSDPSQLWSLSENSVLIYFLLCREKVKISITAQEDICVHDLQLLAVIFGSYSQKSHHHISKLTTTSKHY